MVKIAVISDIQIDLSNGNDEHKLDLLKCCFQNMNADTVIVCGDITENAQSEELNCFFNTYKSNCTSRNLFLIPGNMDETESPDGKKKFLDAYDQFSGSVHENTYFAYETNDYVLVGISPEIDDDDIPLSERQQAFLDNHLYRAAQNGIPAIVICHYIMNDTIQVDWKYATLGAQSLRVKTILEKYHGTVLCFSGHIHRGLIQATGGSLITQNNVTYVSTPSLCVPDRKNYHADNDEEGTGYLLELYPDHIQINGYDYLNNQPMNDFQWSISSSSCCDIKILDYKEDRDYQHIVDSCEAEKWQSMYNDKKEEYRMSLLSSDTLTAYIEDNYCGYIRCITDRSFTIFCCELIVDSTYRRRGIGRLLITSMMKRYPTCRMDLISDSDEFYKRNQFTIVGNGMRKRIIYNN